MAHGKARHLRRILLEPNDEIVRHYPDPLPPQRLDYASARMGARLAGVCRTIQYLDDCRRGLCGMHYARLPSGARTHAGRASRRRHNMFWSAVYAVAEPVQGRAPGRSVSLAPPSALDAVTCAPSRRGILPRPNGAGAPRPADAPSRKTLVPEVVPGIIRCLVCCSTKKQALRASSAFGKHCVGFHVVVVFAIPAGLLDVSHPAYCLARAARLTLARSDKSPQGRAGTAEASCSRANLLRGEAASRADSRGRLMQMREVSQQR